MPSANPQSATRTILGIEGGGTKTEWMLFQGPAAPETLLAQGALPAANLQLISDDGLARLFSVLPREASQVGVFLAGCATVEDRARLHRVAAEAWPDARLALGSDRDSALAAAFGDEDGIVVIAGTGAAVHGRKDGRIEKAGGWGQILGDRGGGYNLAVQGLRLVLTHYDLNQSITPLAEEILRMLGLNRLSDLVGWAMTADKMSVAMLAPAIFHAAKFGEPEMLATVQSGADVLVDFTRAVAQRLEFPKAPVRLCGGLFANHEAYEALYKYRLSIVLPGARAEVCRRPARWGRPGWQRGMTPGMRLIPKDERGREGRLGQPATKNQEPRTKNTHHPLSTLPFPKTLPCSHKLPPSSPTRVPRIWKRAPRGSWWSCSLARRKT